MALWLDLAFGALTGILAAVPSLIAGIAAGFGAMEGRRGWDAQRA